MRKILSLFILFSLANCSSIFQNKPTFLFVQSAKTATYDGKILKLHDASKNTIYFSDRPQRVVGHISNVAFLKMWNDRKQKDSFKKDPPNSAISYYDKNGNPDIAIVEISDITEEKDSISYTVKVLSKKPLPKEVKEATLFIDNLIAILQKKFSSQNNQNNNSSIPGLCIPVPGLSCL